MEKIAGPINGFYVALHATQSTDGTRFTSYAKICRDKPANYWDAPCVCKVFGGEQHATAAAALAMAKMLAFKQINHMPSLDCPTFGLELAYSAAQPA